MTSQPPQAHVELGATKLAEWWIALQVELHGQFSVRRLEALDSYFRHTSWWRVAIVCLLTPMPCIVLVLLQDAVRLADPGDGIYKNYVFWVRDWVAVYLMTYAILQQSRHCLPRLPISNTSLVIVSIFATSVGVSWQFACSHFIGFPLPFGLVIGTCMWTPAVVLGCYTLWQGHLRRDRSLLDDLVQYLGVFLAQVAMTFIYPAYIFIFYMFGPVGQTAFVMVLPFIKMLLKNWIARFLKNVDDLKPEVIIFNIEVFNALYIAYSLQNESAWATTALIMVVDLVLAWLSFQDINYVLHDFRALMAKAPKAKSMPVLEVAMLLLRDPMVRDHPRLQLHSSKSAASSTHQKTIASSAAKASSLAKVYVSDAPPSKYAVDSDVETTPDMPMATANDPFAMLPLEDRVKLVQIALRLLLLVEFIILIEFTEVIMPVIYAMYVVAMSRLPNRQYYPRLAALDEDELSDTAAYVFTYAILELVSLVAILMLLNRKLKFSTFHHIAFVLDTQVAEVQSKLILWTFYVVQSMLFHFGTRLGSMLDLSCSLPLC